MMPVLVMAMLMMPMIVMTVTGVVILLICRRLVTVIVRRIGRR